jgi:hypothetical protein
MAVPNKSNYLYFILLFLIVVLALLRFVHLDADFPRGVTWSGELYTDEGWYANNAVAYVLTGNWHIDGDFNNATNVPILPLMELASFEIFGVSLSSARFVVAVCFTLSLIILYVIVKKYQDSWTALLSVLLLSVNYFMFGYSRLAILEIPMTFFALLSILFATAARDRGSYTYALLASLTLFVALLTKLAGAFAIPIVLFIIWTGRGRRYRKIAQTGIMIAVLGVCYLIYYSLAMRAYPDDIRFYNSNVASRIADTPMEALKGIITAIRGGNAMDRIFNVLALLSCGVVLFVKDLRRKPLVWIAGGWIVLNMALLAWYGLFPPRYYVAVAVGASMIVAIVLNYLIATYRKSWGTIVLIIFVSIYSVVNIYKITNYILTPEYSLVSLAENVKCQSESGNGGRAVILGHFANTVGLAAGILSINDKSGTKDLDYRIKKYAPNAYVSRGPIAPEIQSVLERYYAIEFIEKFDLFHNYATGEPVYFYRLVTR